MKKNILFLLLLALVSVNAQTITGGFPAFKQRGAAAATIRYYCIDNGAGCSGRTIYDGAHLGSSLLGDHTLRLMGGEAKVAKCGSETITAVTMYYRAYKVSATPGTFTALNYAKTANTANDCGGENETWRKIETGEGIPISAGPPNSVVDAPGDYIIEIYYEMITGSGTVVLNNGGNNYKATFTIQNETTWDGSAWDNGVPNANINAVVNGNLNLTSNISTKNLTINSGNTVTLADGIYLKSNGGNVVNNGTIIIGNNASFLQGDGDSYSGTGNAVVYRNANLKRLDYNYWSSPVSGQNLYNFSVGTPTNRFFNYSEATDTFVTTGLDASSSFSPGKGYAIRGKNAYALDSPTSEAFTFTGTPNAGNITVTLQRSAGADKGYNLVGNPYPSNINFNQLFNDNSASIVNKQWFWTNLNEVTAQQGSDYPGNNYATYISGSGGTGPTYIGSVEEPSLKPKQFTKVGQGFIIQAKYNNAPLIFRNRIRSSNIVDSVFFNKTNTEENKEDEPEIINRYWLKLITPQNIGNTILIAYNDYATNNYDEDYDAALLSVGADSFYSTIGTYKLQIQSRSNPFVTSDIIDLGIKCSVAGNHTIAIDEKDGIFTNQAIYLKDNSDGSIHNLQEEHYTFYAPEGQDENRFKIIYQDAVLETNNIVKDNLVIYKHSEGLVMKSKEVISQVDIYDASGRQLYTGNHNSNEIKINTQHYIKGVYIVKVVQKSGITSKKIIL